MPLIENLLDVRFGSLAALLDNISPMSAFPESGRSDWQKLGEIRVRFRLRFQPVDATHALNLAQGPIECVCQL